MIGLALSSMTAAETSAVKPSTIPLLTEKQWQLTSILMTKPLIDVNGDGEPDAEVITSLHPEEREKTMLFRAEGTVWETPATSGAMPVPKGSWELLSSTEILWTFPGGDQRRLRFVPVSSNSIRLVYQTAEQQISYTLETR